MSSIQASGRPPGRPRSPEADRAIIAATLELLAELGYRGLSMEAVRTRAGVGKATIYRRYAGKSDLVKAALRHIAHDLPAPEDSGSLLGDLAALSAGGLASAKATGLLALLPRLLAETSHDEELRALVHEHLVRPRRAVLSTVLQRAVDRGEVRSDVDFDLVVDVLIGSLVYRGLLAGMTPEPLRAHADATAELVLRGLHA